MRYTELLRGIPAMLTLVVLASCAGDGGTVEPNADTQAQDAAADGATEVAAPDAAPDAEPAPDTPAPDLPPEIGDETPPDVAFVQPLDGAEIEGLVAIEVDATDDAGVVSVELLVDQESLGTDDDAPYEFEWNATALWSGTYVLKAVAVDPAGNTGEASVSVTVLGACDEDGDCPPTVSFTAPEAGAFVRGAAEIKAAADDDDAVIKVRFLVDEGLLLEDVQVPWKAAWDSTEFDDGPHALELVAYDTTEKTAGAGIEVIVDNTPPELTLLTPEEGVIQHDAILLSADASDEMELDRVEFVVDDGEPTAVAEEPWEVQYDGSELIAGTHAVTATAFDAAGNEAVVEREFLVDRPPAVAVVSPAPDALVPGPVAVQAEAADDVDLLGVSLAVDGEAYGDLAAVRGTWEIQWTPTYEKAERVLTVTATDSVGQESVATLTVQVDHPLTVALQRCVDDLCEELDADTELTGAVLLRAVAQDDGADIAAVDFLVDGEPAHQDLEEPFDFPWATTSVEDGSRALEAVAINTLDETGAAQVTVLVNNCDLDHDGFTAVGCGGPDCDDGSGDFNPSAPDQVGDGVDQNCDGMDGVDADGDGYASEASGGDDCLDDDAAAHPCGDDLPGDGVDGDCDGVDAPSCDDCVICTVDGLVGDQCVHAPVEDGGACDDGDLCTDGDTCQNLVCLPGVATDCDDQELCTADGCAPETGCYHLPLDDLPCGDGGACVDGACCVPACGGKACGPDGCGGSCGDCGAGEYCDDGGQCVDPASCGCAPWQQCGDPGCVDPPSLGTCPYGGQMIAEDCQGTSWEGCCAGADLYYCETAQNDGCPEGVETCLCHLDCATDGAGACSWLEEYFGCAAPPAAPGPGGALSCDWVPCEPDCQGKACGGDGCGGSCGTCEVPYFCCQGLCHPPSCLVENEFGACPGEAACEDDELLCLGPTPAPEICNGQDDDCDELTDEGYLDTDADGLMDCVDEDDDNDGFVDSVDCQPLDPAAHPGAEELCNGQDDDCDGETDEGFADTDLDGQADCLDADTDGDGIPDEYDNCPWDFNPEQSNIDDDAWGDACDPDIDGDEVPNEIDNCPWAPNPDQANTDGFPDGGDACDSDIDNDGLSNAVDNCPFHFNPTQSDSNQNGIGDACEACVPDCTGKACGGDGCGNSCGACPPGWACTQGGLCEPPLDECGDGECDTGLGESCHNCYADCGPCEGDCCLANGTPGCADGEITICVCDLDPSCCISGWDIDCALLATECGAPCPCEPDCEGKECGDDGCGGSCGACDEGLVCVDGTCTALSECTKDGDCPANQICDLSDASCRTPTVWEWWAPSFFVDTVADPPVLHYPVALDFDGDWDLALDENWWETGDLQGVVYSSVVSTSTHWYLGYFLYFPIRGYLALPPPPGPVHPNTMTGLLLVVEKDGSTWGDLVLMETITEDGFLQYAPEGSPLEGDETIDGAIRWDPAYDQPHHPVAYVRPWDHGVFGDVDPANSTLAWETQGFPGGDGVVYRYGGVGETPAGSSDAVSYRLDSLEEQAWSRRNQVGPGHPFDAFGHFAGSDQEPPRSVPPWAFVDAAHPGDPAGELLYDPADRVRRRFDTGWGEFSQEYAFNPYVLRVEIVDLAVKADTDPGAGDSADPYFELTMCDGDGTDHLLLSKEGGLQASWVGQDVDDGDLIQFGGELMPRNVFFGFPHPACDYFAVAVRDADEGQEDDWLMSPPVAHSYVIEGTQLLDWEASDSIFVVTAPDCPAFCEGKECGDDLCWGTCGDCAAGTECQDGACEPYSYCGGFLGIPCPEGELCLLPGGTCGGEDLFGTCTPIPLACPDLWDPVCGCDGLSYANECELWLAGEPLHHLGMCGDPWCEDDGDCLGLEDGDLCNGTLVCVDWQCVLDPGTVVECQLPPGVHSVCNASACDPETGTCAVVPINEDGACDDDDVCTPTTTCQQGTCTGTLFDCSDGNPCTDDQCLPQAGCVHSYNDEPCEDGNLCTQDDTCVEGDCVSGLLDDCDDGDACTENSCDPETGCVTTPIECLPPDACTVVHSCDPNTGCVFMELPCDDEDLCTEDSCAPDTGCVHEPLDDQSPCGDQHVCVEGQCVCVPDCEGKPCGDDGCGGSCGVCGETCEAAFPLLEAPVGLADDGLEVVKNGDTSGHSSEYEGSCDSDTAGCADLVYSFELSDPMYVSVYHDFVGYHWPSVYLFGGTCEAGNELDCATGTSGAAEIADLSLQPGTYYIIVDASYPGDEGPYNLTVTFVAPEQEESSCADGLDNDDDELTDCEDDECADSDLCAAYDLPWSEDFGDDGEPFLGATWNSQGDCAWEITSIADDNLAAEFGFTEGCSETTPYWLTTAILDVATCIELSVTMDQAGEYISFAEAHKLALFDGFIKVAEIDLDVDGLTGDFLTTGPFTFDVSGLERVRVAAGYLGDYADTWRIDDILVECVIMTFEVCDDGVDNDGDDLVDCEDVEDCASDPGCGDDDEDGIPNHLDPCPSGDMGTCDDGLDCTTDDLCVDGGCAGTPLDCSDGIDCTVDDCIEPGGCTHAPQDAFCPSDNPCAPGVCAPDEGGCIASPLENGTPCGDDLVCVDGACVCDPDCGGKQCGDDGCGDVCGTCPDPQVCTPDGLCETPVVCGDDACDAAEEDCQSCPADCGACTGCEVTGEPGCSGCTCEVFVCDFMPSCCGVAWDDMCAMLCEIGPDGCGCAPQCDGKECGDDFCGGSCGSCDINWSCIQGSCSPLPILCEVDADCLPYEDGDACNGTFHCDLDESPPWCKVDPAMLVPCQLPPDLSPFCNTTACDPVTGACPVTPTNEGGACDDDDLCTIDDLCVEGACAGSPVVCTDGNPCTEDACDPDTAGCVFLPLDDQSPCGDQGVCVEGQCVCVPDCDGMECGDDGCDGSCGECAEGDYCAGGACITPFCGNGLIEGNEECDDGNADTGDGCTPECLMQTYLPAPGDVIITEVMQNPEGVFDPQGEYVEVFNMRAFPINLNGWEIQDAGSDHHQIQQEGPLWIQPGAFLVLGLEADPMQNGGVLVDYQYPDSFMLGNGADEVILGFQDAISDTVVYDGGPGFPDPKGRSMNLDPDSFDHLANDDGSSWCPTADHPLPSGDHGTPGAPNEECP